MLSRLTLCALLVSSGLMVVAPAIAAVETYQVDPTHSSVNFSVRHFFTKTTGRFTRFDAALRIDRSNWKQSSVEARIDVPSISTDDMARDERLAAPDFFDSAKFPTITFKSISWTKTADRFDVAGDLTIKGVTKPVLLKVTLVGIGAGMAPGSTLSVWEASATIRREDFGVNGFPTLSETTSRFPSTWKLS